MAKTLLSILMSLFLITGAGCTENDSQTTAKPKESDNKGSSVRIKTSHGDIVFKLLPEVAPITSARFKELVQEGFYNGLTFHRVIPNFVAQGGDPTATGSGGSGKKLKAEFSDKKHVKGTVAMARAQDVNSADSQFYFALADLPHLDGKYTIFGEVTDGQENLDKIKKGDKMLSVSLE